MLALSDEQKFPILGQGPCLAVARGDRDVSDTIIIRQTKGIVVKDFAVQGEISVEDDAGIAFANVRRLHISRQHGAILNGQGDVISTDVADANAAHGVATAVGQGISAVSLHNLFVRRVVQDMEYVCHLHRDVVELAGAERIARLGVGVDHEKIFNLCI